MRCRSGRGRRTRLDVAFYVPWITPLLLSSPGTSAGGAETQVLLLARALVHRGRRVGIVVFDDGGPLPGQVDGVRLLPRPRWRGDRGILGKAAELATIPRVVAASRADVVVQRAAGPATGLAGLATKALRRSFVYSSANVVDFDFARLEGRLNVFLYHLGVRLADAVVVQTEEQRALCRTRFGREAVVVKSLCEPAERRTGTPDSFLWIGRMRDYKRPLAFVELARMLPDVHFKMVIVDSRGESELGATVRREAARTRNLELLEPRPRAALMSLVESAVAIVNTADFEGMPNVFLEGWARGVPGIALTHDPDGVIAREGLGGFAGGSLDGLASLARRMWADRGDEERLGTRCRRYVAREHGPDALAARWEALLGLPQATALGRA